MAPRVERLSAALGHRFQKPELLDEALTHSSVLADRKRRGPGAYERLEFLGGRVLGLVVAELLFQRFPDEPEGSLTRRLVALVRREALTRVAEEIGLAAYLDSRGDDETPTMLADACEAVIAALYLDGGLEAAAGFIRRHWAPLLLETPVPPKDAKTALQEWAQGRGLPLPAYETVGSTGPSHKPTFTMRVTVKGFPPVEGTGTSKRAAEQAAAAAMLASQAGQ